MIEATKKTLETSMMASVDITACILAFLRNPNSTSHLIFNHGNPKPAQVVL